MINGSQKIKASLTTLRLAGAYHVRVAYRQLLAAVEPAPRTTFTEWPEVTVFMVNYNTKVPTELAIRSLRRFTSYPNYRLLIADNASTDGSGEHLRGLQEELDFELIESPEPMLHSAWLDRMSREVQTPFWFTVDSDLIFFTPDWLTEIMERFVASPDVYIVSAEPAGNYEGTEPINGRPIEMRAQPSTWLFGVRTALRDRVESSYAFATDGVNADTGREIVYDTGGKIMSEMGRKGIRWMSMPPEYAHKYYHYENMSWAFNNDGSSPYHRFKRYQLQDIERRLRSYRKQSLART